MKKKAQKKVPKVKKKLGHDHDCFWREASMKLAKCVIFVIQTDGKLGVGSGMVLNGEGGKVVVERWDKSLIEALAFIGLDVVERPSKKPKRRSRHALGEDIA